LTILRNLDKIIFSKLNKLTVILTPTFRGRP